MTKSNKTQTLKFINELKNENAEIRKNAAEKLGDVGDKRAIIPLIRTLKDNNEDVVITTIKSLAKVSPKDFKTFKYAVKSKDLNIKWNSLEVLGRICNKEAILTLIQTLSEEDREFRWQSAGIIKNIGKNAVEFLIESLDDPNAEIRKEVSTLLGEIGDKKAVKPLIGSLKDSDEEEIGNVRYFVAEALGKIGDKRAVEPLIKSLKDKNEQVRLQTVIALGLIGDKKAIPYLIDCLGDNYYSVQCQLSKSISKIANKDTVDTLTKFLCNEDRSIKIGAALTLGEIGDKRAVKPLIRTLKDTDEEVIRNTAEALGEIGDKRAVKPLIEILEYPNFFTEYFFTEYYIVTALSKIKDKRAVRPLITLLNTNFDSSVDVDRKITIAQALGNIGGNQAIDTLIKLLDKEQPFNLRKWVLRTIQEKKIYEALNSILAILKNDHLIIRENAILALGEIGNEKAILPIIDCLEDKEEWIRIYALKSLGKIGKKSNKDVINPLIKSLADSSYICRTFAADSLGKLGDKKAISPLINSLNDTDTFVQRKVALGLIKVGNEEVAEPLLKALREQDDDLTLLGIAIALLKFGGIETSKQVLNTDYIKWPIKFNYDDFIQNKKLTVDLENKFSRLINHEEYCHLGVFGMGSEYTPLPEKKKYNHRSIIRNPYLEYYSPMELKTEYEIKIKLLNKYVEKIISSNIKVQLGEKIKFITTEKEPEIKIVPLSTFFIIKPEERIVKIKNNKDIKSKFIIRPKMIPKDKKTNLMIEFWHKNDLKGEMNVEMAVEDNYKLKGLKIPRIYFKYYSYIGTISATITVGLFMINNIFTPFYSLINIIPAEILTPLTEFMIISTIFASILYLAFKPSKTTEYLY